MSSLHYNLRGGIPSHAQRLLASPPLAGQGVHQWIFSVAGSLRNHCSTNQTFIIIKAAVQHCGRAVHDQEINDAIRNTRRSHRHPPGRIAAPRSNPTTKACPNGAQIANVLRQWDGYGLADLWEDSCIRLDEGAPNAEEVIDMLFPGNPLLCCGRSALHFHTCPREDWRGSMGGLQHIVPSPMSAVQGVTKKGKPSAHTSSNTGPRRFLVVEFDTCTIDSQAAILRHLACRAPLALVVHSGGKSLHGWFFCEGRGDAETRMFFDDAISLGADPATWTRSQFVRMPEGQRPNGRKQAVCYINPSMIKS